jgi:hypothetical protein
LESHNLITQNQRSVACKRNLPRSQKKNKGRGAGEAIRSGRDDVVSPTLDKFFLSLVTSFLFSFLRTFKLFYQGLSNMYEKEKLNEASFYFSLMVKDQNNGKNFTYFLSAFLSSSRSILQYARAEIEARDKSNLTWYNDFVSKHSPLGFFKDRRDVNIHFIPVQPFKAITVTVHESLTFSESVRVVKRDENGNVVSDRTFENPKPFVEQKEIKPEIEITYRFDEWTGPEDVLALCRMYLKELENFINEAENKGYISS